MRIFGFTIIRSKNHDAFTASAKSVREEFWQLWRDCSAKSEQIGSLARTVANHEETIEALKAKCSLVNVSALENEVRRLRNEKMSGAELQVSDKLEPLVLPSALVQPSTGVEERRTGYRPEPGEGFDLVSE